MPAPASRTLPIVQAEILALLSAIALGADRVEFADRRVAYKSFADMNRALSMLRAEEAQLLGVNRTRIIYPQTSQGLD
jgi:hypothetical protein